MKTIRVDSVIVTRNIRTEEEILNDIGDLLFAQDSGSMADVLVELLDQSYTAFPKELCRKYFDTLTRELKIQAFMWGLDDTGVRDDIYRYFEKHGLPQV